MMASKALVVASVLAVKDSSYWYPACRDCNSKILPDEGVCTQR